MKSIFLDKFMGINYAAMPKCGGFADRFKKRKKKTIAQNKKTMSQNVPCNYTSLELYCIFYFALG